VQTKSNCFSYLFIYRDLQLRLLLLLLSCWTSRRMLFCTA
jgi:hypothetical protein